MSDEITVGKLIEALEGLDPKATVVSPHAMGDGFEDVTSLMPRDMIRRSDEQIDKEYKAGRVLSRYQSPAPEETEPVVECVSIRLGNRLNATNDGK